MRGLVARGSAHTTYTIPAGRSTACLRAAREARRSVQAPLYFVLDLGSLPAGAVQLPFNPVAVSAVPAVACGTRLGLVGLIPGLGCRCWLVCCVLGRRAPVNRLAASLCLFEETRPHCGCVAS